jgi:hypothetical protein
MIRCILSCLLGALLGPFALAADGGATAQDPPALAEHEPYVATLVVRNPHDRAVRVDRTDASCSCARLELATTFLLPRAETTLELVVDNANRSGEQRLGISLYLTDPDLDPIDLAVRWTVRPDVAVDVLAPATDSLARPASAFRDVYRFATKVRPDELHTLRKRIRLESPAESAPPGGLRIEGVEYAGDLWRFEPTVQADGSVLLTATARDASAAVAEGLREEVATVLTNHPRKARITLRFITYIGKDAGKVVLDPDSAQNRVKRVE